MAFAVESTSRTFCSGIRTVTRVRWGCGDPRAFGHHWFAFMAALQLSQALNLQAGQSLPTAECDSEPAITASIIEACIAAKRDPFPLQAWLRHEARD